VSEANNERIWSEPIKDLIDKYADIADSNREAHDTQVISNFTAQGGCTTYNSYNYSSGYDDYQYGSHKPNEPVKNATKPKVENKTEKAAAAPTAPATPAKDLSK